MASWQTYDYYYVPYYYYYIRLMTFFQYNLGKAAPEGKPFWILLEQEMMGCQWHHCTNRQLAKRMKQ